MLHFFSDDRRKHVRTAFQWALVYCFCNGIIFKTSSFLPESIDNVHKCSVKKLTKPSKENSSFTRVESLVQQDLQLETFVVPSVDLIEIWSEERGHFHQVYRARFCCFSLSLHMIKGKEWILHLHSCTRNQRFRHEENVAFLRSHLEKGIAEERLFSLGKVCALVNVGLFTSVVVMSLNQIRCQSGEESIVDSSRLFSSLRSVRHTHST